ncbi:MAG: nicotinamide-nucleotide amidohydrolase family protein [Firmicutes bacterium]|nr:nicotinamide-nucleotide amidohydrolase family protein [Bacillota bacterium]
MYLSKGDNMATFKEIIEELKNRGETIATMESCTGGGVVDAITSIEGASEVLKFSAVTYSNEGKIKMGVSKEVIDKYSVYSIETAHEMAFNITREANANMGVGITGKLNRADINNNYGKDNQVFISIYYKDRYYDMTVNVDKNSRKENKLVLIDMIIEKIGEILWEEGSIK